MSILLETARGSGALCARSRAIVPSNVPPIVRSFNAYSCRILTSRTRRLKACNSAPQHPDWPAPQERYQGLRDEDVLELESFLQVFKSRQLQAGLSECRSLPKYLVICLIKHSMNSIHRHSWRTRTRGGAPCRHRTR